MKSMRGHGYRKHKGGAGHPSGPHFSMDHEMIMGGTEPTVTNPDKFAHQEFSLNILRFIKDDVSFRDHPILR